MTQIIFADSVGAGIRIILADQTDLYIKQGVLVASTDLDAIHDLGDSHHITIDGSIYSPLTGLFDGFPTEAAYNSITVGSTGAITGLVFGIFDQASSSHMSNFGQIYGGAAGVMMAGLGAAASDIFNAGTIASDNAAILKEISDEPLTLTNIGLLRGGRYAFATDGGNGPTTIHNRGVMIGDIVFGNGADTYDGRGGTMDGTVYGSVGADMFIAGLAAETFDGGAGIDTLDFSRGTSITVSLANDVVGNRTAEGDLYTGIENILGSRLGNDKITGDGFGNAISGLGGSDVIRGQGGNDDVDGGGAIDALTGGSGNDRFTFRSLADSGDVISDFRNNLGNDDVIAISAAAFGGGLSPGAIKAGQIVSAADNLARDADDRFIFDTADKTVWFDPDGTGSGVAVLVAHLQATATFSEADILVF